MKEFKLHDHCKVNTNKSTDKFVGIQCKDGDICFHFPMGYRMSEDEEGIRKDIILVLNTIANTVNKSESDLLQNEGENLIKGFPIQAYLYLISDFLEHGYYKETDISFRRGKRGKIDWGKTIDRIKPCFQNGNAVYLEYITRRTSVVEDELITLIHQYCVYESFSRIGWIFTSTMPELPQVVVNDDLFRTIVSEKLTQTFNDEKRRLFSNMLCVIDQEERLGSRKNYMFGTNRYEYVWEKMIDKVFGIKDKERFFPRTHWIIDGKTYDNACLEPDSIMIYHNDVYILDAKYYKYGATKSHNPKDLPESTSINKQITYGEYVASQEEFKSEFGDDFKTYNAFLMPSSSGINYQRCGIAYSDWKKRDEPYENIVGVLIDLNYLINLFKSGDRSEIPLLAEEISKAFDQVT